MYDSLKLPNLVLTIVQPPLPSEGPINLVIAVSFGLFVPPRILNGAKYGGLNLHPSLLPEYALTVTPVPRKLYTD